MKSVGWHDGYVWSIEESRGRWWVVVTYHGRYLYGRPETRCYSTENAAYEAAWLASTAN